MRNQEGVTILVEREINPHKSTGYLFRRSPVLLPLQMFFYAFPIVTLGI